MKKLRDLKIATQLALGFVVLLIMFLALGMFAIFQSGQIEKQSETMYNHPFKVKRALSQLESDLLKIRIAERDLYLSLSISNKNLAVETIRAINDSIALRFQLLYKSYLGPLADIDKAKIAFGNWKQAQDENIQLALSGDVEKAKSNILSQAKLSERHEIMMNNIASISNFANNKAEELYKQSYELNKTFNRDLRLLLVAILMITALVTYLMVRSIRRPLREITFATDHFHKGNLNVRSGYKSDNEFGKLSQSFNAMAEIIKQQILENEKLSKQELSKLNNELSIQNVAITLSESKLEIANEKLNSQNEELNQQNEELSCQNEELSSQNDEIVRREADLSILNNDLADVSEAHRISNEYLENLFRYANTPIIVWNPDFLITRFNPAFELLTGMNASQMIGQHLKILFPPDSADEAMLQIKKTEKGRRMETVEIKIKNIKGGVYTLLWNSASVLSNDRSIFMATIAQGYDITKRKEVETELALSEERFRTTLDNMIEGCQIIDFQWRYQYLNTAALLQSRCTKDELIGKCYTDVWPGAEETQVYAFMKQCMEDKTPHHIENEFIYPDSSTAWFDLSIQAVSQGIFIKSVDITRRKKVQNELKIANSELALQFEEKVKRTAELESANKELVMLNIEEEKRTNELLLANQELEQFAYVATHDLQEPLRMISSYTQLLERKYKDKLDADANDYIHYAVDGAIRMQKLINDLLEYSRVSSRAKALEPVDATAVLGKVISNLHQLISENNVLITHDELPEVKADESQLLRLFQNLIENAIKFRTKTGLPKIHIACEKNDKEFKFSVSDNGIGMDMQYHDRVFIIFQRLHSVREYPGTGIGLSICKRIVDRHQGKIWFNSTENEGTTFYFTIKQ